MTIPVPLTSDPIADAALHIRSFAEGVEARLTAPLAVRTFDTGEKLNNANGEISISRPSGLASVSGAVFSPVELLTNGTHKPAGSNIGDIMYAPVGIRSTDQPSTIWLTSYNGPTGARLAGRYVRYAGLVWGPPTTAAELGEPAPAPLALPPGSLFPPGVTAHGIHYPGTDETQWGTAAAIGELADDIGAAIGGSPLGLQLYTWSGNVTTSSAGYAQVPFAGKLTKVTGVAATAWDASGAYRQTRLAALNLHPSNNPQSTAWLLITTNTQSTDVGADYAARVRSTAVGLQVIAWGV